MTELLSSFADFARRTGIFNDSYLVGGTVRDLLLGNATKDFDLALRGDPLLLGRAFAREIGGSFVLLDERFSVVRIVREASHIDLTSMRGETITDDLSERDLTINAMAIPLELVPGLTRTDARLAVPTRDDLTDRLIDPFGGKKDLDCGIVRMVSEGNLAKDPLRLLRVYRFSCTLNFLIDISTSVAVRHLAPLIEGVAVERIADELRHILRFRFSAKTLKEMDSDGLLAHIFPELGNISSEAWHRTMRSYAFAEHILENLALYFPGQCTAAEAYFSSDRRLLGFKLAVFLSFGNQGDRIALRLKMSRREVGYIRQMQRHHGRVESLLEAPTPARARLLRECREDVYALIVSAIAGHYVCQCNDHPLLALCRELLRFYHEDFTPRLKLLPLITGEDLKKEFGLAPSPVFKKLLAGVADLTLDGRVGTREEALQAAGDMLKQERSVS